MEPGLNLRLLPSGDARLGQARGKPQGVQSASFKLAILLFRAALGGMALLLLAGTSAAQCALNATSPSVTICQPSNGSTSSSPVAVVAGTTDNAHPVMAMKVYVNNVAAYSVQAGQLSTSLNMTGGKHSVTVNAWDSGGNVFKTTVTITVTAAGTAPVSVAISPSSAALAPGQTQQFTSTVLNTSNTAVSWTVDGFYSGNTTVGTITTNGLYTAGTSLGQHNVMATSVADPTKSDTAIVTVTSPSTGGGPCAPTSGTPSLTICNPVSGASVTSPVHVQAVGASNTAITKFMVYVDYQLAYQVLNTASIDTTLSMSAGTHNLTAQFYNGAWVKQSESFVVTAAPLPVTVSLSPTSASVPAGGTQQFTASVQNTSNTAVTWSTTGGTITGTGATVTYTAPTTLGPYTVAATSVADSTKSASATVTVTSAAAGFPSSSHVFVVMEENQDFSQVFPAGLATNCYSSAMPYLCGLAAANGMASNFYANAHGSALDYIYNTSGGDWTASPSYCAGWGCKSTISKDNIVRAITAAGMTWRGYFEDMPYQGYMGWDTANYVVRHNPFRWYSDVAGSDDQQSNMYPFTQFAADVNANTFANFSYIIPNMLDDAEGDGGESANALLSSADTWLQANLPSLLATPPFQPGGDGILIVTFDEGDEAGDSGDSSTDNSCSPSQSSGCGGHIPFVMIGPNVVDGSTTSNIYHFQDMLHTVIHLLGLSDYMNGAAGAADIALLPGVGQ